MAVVLTNKIPQQAVALGNVRARIVNVALALNDYVTGGIAVSAASVSLNELYGAVVIGQDGTAVGYVPVWDAVNNKILLFQNVNPAAAGGADVVLNQVGNGASTAITLRLLVFGV